jgi:hypothetical protein
MRIHIELDLEEKYTEIAVRCSEEGKDYSDTKVLRIER